MADGRLSVDDWVRAGLQALAAEGFAALKADTLTKALGVSRGSFYWHFADVGAFHTAVLERWQQIAYDNIVAEMEGSAENRLKALLSRAFRAELHLERAVRSWAVSDAKAMAMVLAVDTRRMAYIQNLLLDMGVKRNLAAVRSRVLYWTFLGRVLALQEPRKQDWLPILEELSRMVIAPA